MSNGILLALIAYASYSFSDAVIKSLGGQFTVFEIGFFSTLFAGCFLFFKSPGTNAGAISGAPKGPGRCRRAPWPASLPACSASLPSPPFRWRKSMR
nr:MULTISPECIES: hypothetical protein [unclassified Mesorhizobium]